jgi:hypothetical protein
VCGSELVGLYRQVNRKLITQIRGSGRGVIILSGPTKKSEYENSCFQDHSTLKREAEYSSEVFVSSYKISPCQNSEHHNINSHLPENYKIYKEKLLIF